MTGGKDLASGLRAGKDNGIPWFVLLDASQPILIPAPPAPEGKKRPAFHRREAAILATADGPEGNVGCPMTQVERAHFMECIRTTRKAITDNELAVIAAELHQYAVETIGKEAGES